MFQIRNGVAVVPGGEKGMAGLDRTRGRQVAEGGRGFLRASADSRRWLGGCLLRCPGSHQRTHARLSAGAQAHAALLYGDARTNHEPRTGPPRVSRQHRSDAADAAACGSNPNGKPHIPATWTIWKNLFINHPHGKYDGKLTKAATGWKEPDDLIEALFALCRKAVENEPLKIYMAMTDLNRYRVDAARGCRQSTVWLANTASTDRSTRFSPKLQRFRTRPSCSIIDVAESDQPACGIIS